MISLFLNMFGMGMPGEGLFAVLLGGCLAMCAICGLYKCSQIRMRDCACIKRCMRVSGADKFDDFEMTVLVHEALYTTSKLKISTRVRITAGSHVVQTDESSKGIYQQPLQLFVEQGTDTIKVELMDSREKKVVAVKHLDAEKDILQREAKDKEQDTIYQMKQKSKGLLNPKIRLTILLASDNAAEQGLLANMNVSQESNLMLRQLQQKALADPILEGELKPMPLSELELLVKGCAGPLDKFGSWGSRSTVYAAVRGPPDAKKYSLAFWKNQHEYEKGSKPDPEIDILRIGSIQPDPHPRRSEIFVIQYVDPGDKMKKRLTLRRIDRARDVWVEILQKLIRLVRDQKEAKKRYKH